MIKKEILENLYNGDKKTTIEIAKILNTSVFNVSYYRKKYGIKKLERWQRLNVKKFIRIQKEYLLGSLLGDDHIRRQGKYAYLQVVHSSKSREYVEWKYKLWKQLTQSAIKTSAILLNGKKYHICRFNTLVHPEFNYFHKLFYGSGKKAITTRVLKQLTPFSIAVWYMDDGYYRRERGRATLCTHSFTLKENLLIKTYFKKKWNIKCNIGYSTNGKSYIWFNTENTIKFFSLIKDFILTCFSYKIDLNRKLLWKKLSIEEIDYIKKNYNKESPRLIAYKLNRSIHTIFGAAWRLGLTQSKGGRKMYEKDLQK